MSMENSAEGNAKRLERLNRYLMVGVIALAIIVVLLAVSAFV